jgi:hypothetical protein
MQVSPCLFVATPDHAGPKVIGLKKSVSGQNVAPDAEHMPFGEGGLVSFQIRPCRYLAGSWIILVKCVETRRALLKTVADLLRICLAAT